MPHACVDVLTPRGDSDLEMRCRGSIQEAASGSERVQASVSKRCPAWPCSFPAVRLQVCHLQSLSLHPYGEDEDNKDEGYLED